MSSTSSTSPLSSRVRLSPPRLLSSLPGEAAQFGRALPELIASFLASLPSSVASAAFIGTGEFTVTLRGKGVGGRNQEMLLAYLQQLMAHPASPHWDLVVLSAAFDGIEGNSPACGGIVSSATLQRARSLGLDPAAYLERNDAHAAFHLLGDALVTGHTGTNVNDLTLILAQRKGDE